jgi:hypothetical protein
VAPALVLFVLTVGVAIMLAISAEDFGLPAQAKKRARELFLSKLNDSQRKTWVRRHRFDVTASSGRRYTISPYGAFNVTCGDDSFCVQIDGRIPTYDKLLAQVLLITADERLFRTTANIRKRRRGWKNIS